jgi:hypothetical protein
MKLYGEQREKLGKTIRNTHFKGIAQDGANAEPSEEEQTEVVWSC